MDLVPKSHGNADGKGTNGFLRDWHHSRPRGVVAKPPRRVLAELFTSLLALSAEFRYRPVVKNPNYLYWVDGRWVLSLIAPEEWSDARREGFAGTVVLQPDMTWTITPSKHLSGDSPVATALRQFYEEFVENLDTDRTFEEMLPFHVRALPYYQRLYASGLSRSLRAAVSSDDLASASCRQWRMQIRGRDAAMLAQQA